MTTFIIELRNKITGEVTTQELDVICNDPQEFKIDYCKKMRRAYLGAKTANVVSRMYIKS